MERMKRKTEVWTWVSIALLITFLIFFIYPMANLLRQAFYNENGFTLDNFQRFFSHAYYTNTIKNSFKVSILTTVASLLVGIPFSYFYSFYNIKGRRLLIILSVICCMSAPFVGAYAWILLLGKAGTITKFFKSLGIIIPTIYGMGGIILVQTSKFYPLVLIYLNGAFRNIDNTLMEASENLGCTGIRRFWRVLIQLSMPTVLAAALLVFMRAFADFGTPMLIGEGYKTFPVEIYTQFVSEMADDWGFACAISCIAIIITGLIYMVQKIATQKYQFSLNALHPIERKDCKGIKGVLMNMYCYIITAIAILPQIYVIYCSFRNSNDIAFMPGYGFGNYIGAVKRGLWGATKNTIVIGSLSLLLIIIIAIFIAYLTVRRKNKINNSIDTIAMLPYIMPGSVIGIALLTSFNKPPIAISGTIWIMITACVIRRLPYTIRSASATLMQIPMSMEEASISLGSSKMKTFFRVTVPMMSSGIISGGILSFVAIITEVSSAIILYNNSTMTLTIGTYITISYSRGIPCAFATVTTLITVIVLLVYIKFTGTEDIKL